MRGRCKNVSSGIIQFGLRREERGGKLIGRFVGVIELNIFRIIFASIRGWLMIMLRIDGNLQGSKSVAGEQNGEKKKKRKEGGNKS